MRPRLLDLFCGAGGAAKGYQRAGFYVVGVDIKPQPNYCGDEFVQAEALGWLSHRSGFLRFDAVHASPPCQMYSRNMRHLSGPQPMLIDPVRDWLARIGLPWVIENVEGAPLPSQPDLLGGCGVVLCGTSFGMRTWRHRWFETSFEVPPARPCSHRFRPLNPNNSAGRAAIYEEFGSGDVPDWPEVVWRRDLGIEWMDRYEGREAIPPKFTEYVGSYLMAEVEARQRAVA